MKLIVNADDFGYSKGVNYGIIDCFNEGIVTATTILTTMPGSQHAYQLAKNTPQLDIGVHLTLDLGIPTLPLEQVPSLINSNGTFKSFKDWKNTTLFFEQEIYNEWKNQIETVIKQGITPTHIDSHHHIHMIKPLFFTFIKLAQEYKLAIRFHPREWDSQEIAEIQSDIKQFKKADTFSSAFYGDKVATNFFESLPATDQTWEIMCHPAYLDSELFKRTSYLNTRVTEVEVLTSEKTKSEIQRLGIELISFKNL